MGAVHALALSHTQDNSEPKLKLELEVSMRTIKFCYQKMKSRKPYISASLEARARWIGSLLRLLCTQGFDAQSPQILNRSDYLFVGPTPVRFHLRCSARNRAGDAAPAVCGRGMSRGRPRFHERRQPQQTNSRIKCSEGGHGGGGRGAGPRSGWEEPAGCTPYGAPR